MVNINPHHDTHYYGIYGIVPYNLIYPHIIPYNPIESIPKPVKPVVSMGSLVTDGEVSFDAAGPSLVLASGFATFEPGGGGTEAPADEVKTGCRSSSIMSCTYSNQQKGGRKGIDDVLRN